MVQPYDCALRFWWRSRGPGLSSLAGAGCAKQILGCLLNSAACLRLVRL
jgi:hypothetical protein